MGVVSFYRQRENHYNNNYYNIIVIILLTIIAIINSINLCAHNDKVIIQRFVKFTNMIKKQYYNNNLENVIKYFHAFLQNFL